MRRRSLLHFIVRALVLGVLGSCALVHDQTGQESERNRQFLSNRAGAP